ncbi:RapZ C-terminal domain-containing protein [Streptomyces acidicola]|uniref:ATPase n=1 Tax=Streptomyces acidicola TaxID=2596892 RepID=A0A5N8WL89_9ACTN|nr:RNase adapter RapZ [Streptomyces acidicola]MPY47119.1 ATPase [Streptomyces acidicola]MPY47258.1 ATPase [Streptomyces acidicola]
MATVEIVSFGFGHAGAPAAHLVLDLREHFRDPHVDPRMRELTGFDRLVRRTVLHTSGVRRLLRASTRQVQAFVAGPSGGRIVVAPGCAGGRHRSVVVAEQLARRLRRRGHEVTVEHRDIRLPVIDR